MKLKDIVTLKTKSIVPLQDEHYHLYSLPSFDKNQCREEILGKDIQSNKYIVPDKCILFNKLNVRFKRVWRIDNKDNNKLCSTEFLPLIIDKTKVNYQYCYYLLISERITDYLCGQNTNTSGSHKRIDPLDFLNIDIQLPFIEEQTRIGSLLAYIDSKIALNRAINHNLEAMAKQLYDYWFVQFDFQNEEGKPYKSSGGKIVWNEKLKREIPEGWKLQSYGDLCHINKVTLSRKEDIQYIEYLDTSSLTKGVISATQELDRCKAPSRAQRKVEDLTILYSCVRPRLLHYGILCNPTKNLIASTGFATIDAIEKEHSFMLYMHLTTLDITEYLASIADTAVSSYPSINPSDIASLETLVPPKCIVRKFQERIEPMFRLKEKIRLENTNLTKQRDELLPLLMNGQVSVNYDLSHD